LITPPNSGSGAGSCLPLIVVVALGDPGVPVVSCAALPVEATANPTPIKKQVKKQEVRFMVTLFLKVSLRCASAIGRRHLVSGFSGEQDSAT
jgi:hypothetical protein